MKGFLKNIPLYKKVLHLSFIITFLIVAITAVFSYYLQSENMEELLSQHAMDAAGLWGSTIESEDIEAVLASKNVNDSHFNQLKESLQIFNENNHIYLNSFIIDSNHGEEDEIFVITLNQNQESNGWISLSGQKVNRELMKGYKEVQRTGQHEYTRMYEDENGTWITAFSPIENNSGEMIAMFGVNINADSIKSAQNKYLFLLVMLFVIMAPIIYFILKYEINRILQPVNQLVYGLNEVSKGNFNIKLKVKDNTELGLVCEKFNYMTNQLATLVEKLVTTSEKLGSESQNIILHNLEDVFDEVGNIIEKSKIVRELQRAEKMNAIGQLAASVAHEIRNPMTVVKGFLQIFLSKEQMSEEERMYIRLMIEEMNRAETIINDYLSLAKPDMNQTENIDGKELAEKVMDLMNSYAMMSKNITMSTPVIEKLAVKGNKSELQQVLINILKNGIEAMKSGGELSLSLYKEGSYAVFEIKDTGVGMTVEEMERLGTAFYSLKEKGTGMGLTVCYQIIERMKGRIVVKSEKNVGTTFKIYTPVWE